MQNISFEELSSMPMQCYGCGKPLRHLSIVNAMNEGEDLQHVMDRLNYKRLCCRQVVQTQPAIHSLRKRLESNKSTSRQLNNLTLESTGTTGDTGVPGD